MRNRGKGDLEGVGAFRGKGLGGRLVLASPREAGHRGGGRRGA